MPGLVKIIMMVLVVTLMIAYPIFTWMRKAGTTADWFWNALAAETILGSLLVILFYL